MAEVSQARNDSCHKVQQIVTLSTPGLKGLGFWAYRASTLPLAGAGEDLGAQTLTGMHTSRMPKTVYTYHGSLST